MAAPRNNPAPLLSSGAPSNIPAAIASADGAIKSVTIKSAQTSKIQILLQPLNAPGFSGLAQLGSSGS